MDSKDNNYRTGVEIVHGFRDSRWGGFYPQEEEHTVQMFVDEKNSIIKLKYETDDGSLQCRDSATIVYKVEERIPGDIPGSWKGIYTSPNYDKIYISTFRYLD